MNSSSKQKDVSYSVKLRVKQSIPNVITFLRLIALPSLIYSFNYLNIFVTSIVFLAVIISDLVDGYIARKIGSTSKFGAYLDVIVDFLFINGTYLFFSFKGIYSPWILLVIIFAFAQFIISNILSKRMIYDPVGKYFGSILFGGIGITILISEPIISNFFIFSDQIVYIIITVSIVVSALATILSRFTYLIHNRR